MGHADDGLACDGCDTLTTNADVFGRAGRQQRFLAAYRVFAYIAPAARLARVHRATVHRWLADPAFAAALRAAFDDFIRRHRAEVARQDYLRELQKELRARELRPLRAANLARARAAGEQRRQDRAADDRVRAEVERRARLRLQDTIAAQARAIEGR